MSDNERIDWSLARVNGGIRQIAHRFRRGSPLLYSYDGEDQAGRSSIENFNRFMAEYTHLLETNHLEGSRMQMPFSPTEHVPQYVTNNLTVAAAPAPEQQGPKKPVSTLVSLLPKTVYNERKEAEGTKSSLAYIKAQRNLLKWLGRYASDLLTPEQALKWTQNIAGDKRPQAKEALSLCYYMRSQGFDTYADVRDGSISLYVTNQQTHTRGPQTDRLYWKQMIKTDEIVFMASSFDRPARRNALIPAPSPDTIGGLLNHLAAPSRPRAPRASEQNHGEGRNPPQDDRPTQNQVQVLIAAAQATLDDLLAGDNPDPIAVEGTIMQMEELRAQVHEG